MTNARLRDRQRIGINDLDRIAPEEFTRDMTRILDIIVSRQRAPSASTIPDRLDRAEAGRARALQRGLIRMAALAPPR